MLNFCLKYSLSHPSRPHSYPLEEFFLKQSLPSHLFVLFVISVILRYAMGMSLVLHFECGIFGCRVSVFQISASFSEIAFRQPSVWPHRYVPLPGRGRHFGFVFGS